MTECDVTTTLQVLDLEGTTPETTGSKPVEDGITPLIAGQPYIDVVFTVAHPVYSFDELLVENFSDNPPVSIFPTLISFEDENGFRVMLNASPDSAFYQLRWRVTI